MSFKEIPESGSLRRTKRSYSARRMFQCDEYENAEALAPAIGEAYPGKPELTVDSVEIQPHGAVVIDPTNPGRLYTHARIIVDYVNPWLEAGPQEISNINTYPMIFQISDGLIYGSDSEAITTPINITVHCSDVEIFQRRPQIPWAEILACQNKINTYAWKGCTPGTVLFNGCDANHEFDPAIGTVYHLTFKFSWLPIGWNSVPRGAAWDTAQLYDYESFQILALGD